MALPQIAPLQSEFDMPQNKQSSEDAVKKEIAKIGQVIESKISKSFKSATQAVLGDVPKIIGDLTKEIEKGPVDSFASAMNKLITMVDKLGINLRDYNDELADLVNDFKGTQEQINQKILEYKPNQAAPAPTTIETSPACSIDGCCNAINQCTTLINMYIYTVINILGNILQASTAFAKSIILLYPFSFI